MKGMKIEYTNIGSQATVQRDIYTNTHKVNC